MSGAPLLLLLLLFVVCSCSCNGSCYDYCSCYCYCYCYCYCSFSCSCACSCCCSCHFCCCSWWRSYTRLCAPKAGRVVVDLLIVHYVLSERVVRQEFVEEAGVRGSAARRLDGDGHDAPHGAGARALHAPRPVAWAGRVSEGCQRPAALRGRLR